MDPVKPMTLQDHIAVVETVRAEAMAVDKREVTSSSMPVEVFLQENRTVIAAADKHFDTLSRKGFTREMIGEHQRYIDALDSAQTLWRIERRGGRGEEAAKTIDDAEKTKSDLLAAGDLALRAIPAGQDRLGAIREGDGLADLTADLGDLAVLVTDFREAFEAIKLDVDAASTGAATLREQLKVLLAEEKVDKSLKGYKELRDRIFVLARRTLREIRMFADYAFREDRTDVRRKLFVSPYNRRVRARSKSSQSTETAAVIG